MKKTVLFGATALLLVSSAAQAQTPSAMQIGVTAGVSMATLVGDDLDDADRRNAPYFGGSLVWQPAGSMIGFKTGLLYVPKGAKFSDEDGDGTLKLDYVEIPLLLRIAVPMAANIQPALLVGGSLGFKSSCKVAASFEGVSVDADCDDFGDEFDIKTVDLGLSAGLSVDVPVGMRWVFAPSVRYTRGLSDVADDADAKNSAIQVGASLRFRM